MTQKLHLGLQTTTSIFKQKIPARSAKIWYRQTDRAMFASKKFLLTQILYKTGASSYIRHMPPFGNCPIPELADTKRLPEATYVMHEKTTRQLRSTKRLPEATYESHEKTTRHYVENSARKDYQRLHTRCTKRLPDIT
jgi:hypothetical protein